MDTGAEASIIRLSCCMPNAIVETNRNIQLKSFSNKILASSCVLPCEIGYEMFTAPCELIGVSDEVQMNGNDVILGYDFLSANKAIIDTSVGIISFGDAARVVYNTKKPSVLKNRNEKKREKGPKPKISDKKERAITNMHVYAVPVSNAFSMLDSDDLDVYYGSDYATCRVVRECFDKEKTNELDASNCKILFGCAEQLLFCNANKENVNKTEEKKAVSLHAKPAYKRIEKKTSSTVDVSAAINNEPSKYHAANRNKNVLFAGNVSSFHAYSYDEVDTQKASVYVYDIFALNRLFYDDVTKENKSMPCTHGRMKIGQHMDMLLKMCTDSMDLCNVKSDNIHLYFLYLIEYFDKFVKIVKLGTSQKMITATLNMYNLVLYEMRKFLIRESATRQLDLNQFSYSLGKLTIEFDGLFRTQFNLDCILQYLFVVRKELVLIAKTFKNVEILPNERLNMEEINNDLRKEILSIHRVKEYITIPARSQKLVSIIVDSNDEQLCFANELAENVYIGNCVIRPVNNLVTICILNSSENDFNLNSVELPMDDLNEYNILGYDIQECQTAGDRNKALFEKIKFENLNFEEKYELEKLLAEYNHIFHLDNDELTFTNAITHRIRVKEDTRPIQTKQYRLPLSQRQEIDKEVGKLLKDGVISPSTSEWCSPLVVVPRKSLNGERRFRVCCDLKKLNECTVGDVFPIADMTEIIESTAHSKLFSVIDLRSGYHQILIDPRDRHYTAFSVGSSAANNNLRLGNLYDYNQLPFGLALRSFD